MSIDLQAALARMPAVASYGLRVAQDEDGLRMHARLDADSAVLEGAGTAHGGVVASILDTAVTFAIAAASNARWVTVDLRVDYLRPTALGDVSCVTQVLSQGSRIGVVRAELIAADSAVTALATATMSRMREEG